MSEASEPQIAMTPLSVAKRLRAGVFYLWRSSFVRNLATVMTGSTAAQALGFLLSPIISRLFTPSEFGVFGTFSSAASIIAAGVTLEYSQAVMVPKERRDAFHLFLASCLATLLVTALCMLCCLAMPNTVKALLKADSMWPVLLLAFSPLVIGLNASCQAWCVRIKAFKATALSQVIRSLSANGMQVGFGYAKFGSLGLIIADVLADLVATLNLARNVLGELKRSRDSVSWQHLKKLAREYVDFPLYSASQNVMNALSSGLPVFLLTYYFGLAVAGAYAFGVRILSVPMSFVLRALRQVLFQKAGETHHQGRPLAPLYFKITGGLLAMACLPGLILAIWAPDLFSFVFGGKWVAAGEYARSLILWLAFAFCNLPAVLFARLLRIQRAIFVYEVVLLAVRAGVLIIGGIYFSPGQTIFFFSAIGALMNVLLIFVVGRAVVRSDSRKQP